MTGSALVASIGLIARAVGAVEPEHAFTYDVPKGCPGPDVFAAEVDKRTNPSARGPTRAMRVTVMKTRGGYEGRLEMAGDVPERARVVRSATCGEVVQALALVVATLTSTEADEPYAAGNGEPSEQERASRPLAPSVAESPPAALPPSAVAPVGGIDFGGTTVAGPSAGPAVGVFDGVQARNWSVRIHGSFASGGTAYASGGGSVAFRLFRASMEGCPFLFSRGSLHLEPCASVEAGTLRGSSRAVEDAGTSSTLWLAAGVAARLRWEVSLRWFVEAEARGVVPWLRPSFFVRPAETVFHVSPFGAEAIVSAGGRFWK